VSKILRREYIVLFCDSEFWVRRILKKQFGHVLVMSIHDGILVKIDPWTTGLNTEIVAKNFTVDMLRKLDNIKALKVTTHRSKSMFAKVGIMTCTDVVQYVLGTRYKWCWTPYQLYKKLMMK
jgi:hypothetical protein